MAEEILAETAGRRVCTREMVAEAMTDLILKGIVSRVDGKIPTIAAISAWISDNYDRLTPSPKTLMTRREEVLADMRSTSTVPVIKQAQPALLSPELTQVIDQFAQQQQTLLGNLATVLATMQQRSDEDMTARLRLMVEQGKRDVQQENALAVEEMSEALQQSIELREQLDRLTRELDLVRTEAANERGRADAIERINSALLIQLGSSGTPVRAVEPVVDEQQSGEQTDESEPDVSTTDTPAEHEQEPTTVSSSSARRAGRPKSASSQKKRSN